VLAFEQSLREHPPIVPGASDDWAPKPVASKALRT
jgi:hypothetical protein